MMVLWFALLLTLAGAAVNKSKETQCRRKVKPGEETESNPCNYQCVLTHLDLKNRKVVSAARPVKNWTRPTEVNLELYLNAILEVKWKDELISWNPADFCGIKKVLIPRDMIWRPDLMVLECMQDQHKMFMMPYVQVYHDGYVSQGDALKAKSTCNIDAYKFPFDTQSCDLTFCSVLYTDDEILFKRTKNSSWLTHGSREHLRSQGEWDFINIRVKEGNITVDSQRWSTLTYTITFKRRPMVIVLHLMLPLLFFLILDLCTFIMSVHGGDHLGFKVTLLLAISVLLLILNEILPSSSRRPPLIAIYCIGTFTLLFVSLLEAIVVKYLIERDDTAVEDPAESETHAKEESAVVTSSEPDPAVDPHHQQSEDVFDGLLVPSRDPDVGSGDGCTDSQLLRRAAQVLHTLRRSILTQTEAKREEKTPLYWTRVAERLNKAFFSLYFIAVIVMLVFLSVQWSG